MGSADVLYRLALSAHYNAGHNALELAAALEQKSSHPLANAVVSAHCGCIAEMEGELPAAKKIKTIEGVGIAGLVEFPKGIWKRVCVGMLSIA
jgi:cation transport ATPase